MALRNLIVPKEVLAVGSGPDDQVSLRGLNFNDLKVLFAQHADELTVFFKLLQDAKKSGQIDEDAMTQVAISLLQETPAMFASAVALAADEPEAVAVAASLPFPVQIEAIQMIGRLTFGTEGAAKKLLATVSKIAASYQAYTKPK